MFKIQGLLKKDQKKKQKILKMNINKKNKNKLKINQKYILLNMFQKLSNIKIIIKHFLVLIIINNNCIKFPK